MSTVKSPQPATHEGVARSVGNAPIFGVVRTQSHEQAERHAGAFIQGGLELIEVTLTVPRGLELIRKLRAERGGDGPPWIGAGTVTTGRRALAALEHGAEFLITPNVTSKVAEIAHQAGAFLIIGALTPTEILAGHALGADLIKAFPLPPVGGASYLAAVRGPINNVPLLAAGGFGASEITAYRDAGAVAFGLGSQLLTANDPAGQRREIQQALSWARGDR